jgi:LmbE family N-acetylglucosaminyl deacetylase
MPRSRSWKKHLGALPLCSPEQVIGPRNVLVIAPHPDDETLGCGGLLAWAVANGRRARVVVLTDGERSHPGSARFPPARLAGIRQREALAAGARLGLAERDYAFLHLPDGGLESLTPAQADALTRSLRRWIESLAPVIACVTASSDSHGDHRVANALAVAATRGVVDGILLAYPVWSWLNVGAAALPSGRRIDITRYRDVKQAAIRAHASQLGRLVDDVPDPFELPAALLECVTRRYEVLLDASV